MNKTLVVVPDMTRKAHLKTILPKVLSKLDKASVKIIIATGLHRPHTKDELKGLVGKKIFSGYEVATHTQKKSDLVHRGKTKTGVPIVLNKSLFETDSIITIGLIEPHLYAGYSGGAKTIAIGLAGEATINATHHPRFLDKEGTLAGSINGNPFQDCLWEIIKGIPVAHSINVVNNKEGNILKVFEGDLRASYLEGVKFAKTIFEHKLNKRFDAVICKMSPPKDANMYQASRGFNYVLNVKSPIVKKGGMVLVSASLKEGFGDGIAEKRFGETLRNMRSPRVFIDQVKKKGCLAGEHRAYMVAKALMKAKLGFIGPGAASRAKGLPFFSFSNVNSAENFIREHYGKNAEIYYLPNALTCVYF